MKRKMKSIVIFIMFIAGLLTACQSEKSWQISGEWKEGEGRAVYLMQQVGDTLLPVDSALVRNGKYRMTGNLERMDRYILRVGNFRRTLFLDNQPIVGYFAPSKYDTTIMALTVRGSREQEMLILSEDYIMSRIMCAAFGVGKVELAKYDASMVPVVDSNLDLHTTAMFLTEMLQTEYPFADLLRQYESLSPEVKASWMGQELAEKIEAEKRIRVGGTAAAIELADPEGRIRKLSDLRGKCVIIDFWASWCGPCRRKFPELKALYADYRDAGLEVFGVSLDDKKEAWTKAVADLQLPWMHVSSLKGWECPVAKTYKVTGIPKMYLLDKEGVIVGVDLSEQELREKLDVLLKNK